MPIASVNSLKLVSTGKGDLDVLILQTGPYSYPKRQPSYFFIFYDCLRAMQASRQYARQILSARIPHLVYLVAIEFPSYISPTTSPSFKAKKGGGGEGGVIDTWREHANNYWCLPACMLIESCLNLQGIHAFTVKTLVSRLFPILVWAYLGYYY